ncbi:ribbon-helix-helix protein, CopG family [Streptomyces thermolineatus]|uniref:ribbon-helix-helix protein, CopG family n=1 Tax=Streptomyces thermolineatus TaxID=44033 RepID=UPI00384E9C85
MGSRVLSLRIDGDLLDRLHGHAAKRGMSVQDYVVRTLTRDDFDERFRAAVERAERFHSTPPGRPRQSPAGTAAGDAPRTAAT